VSAVLNVVIYIVAAAIGLLLSCLSMVFAVLSGPQFASLIGGLLVAAHIGSVFYVRRKAIQGKGRQAAIVLVLPLPLVMSVLYVFGVGGYAVSSFLERESSTFTSACQTAGAKFYKLPALPVHSLAYDWESKAAPAYNDYSLEFGGRVSALARPDSRHPGTITFTERKRSDWGGVPSGAPDPYVRFPRDGASYGIAALTADVLVEYRLTPGEELRKSDTDMVVYVLTVTDRRNGEKLASLRYVLDVQNKRVCGLTEDHVINERTFVFKAIGVQ
jgi:hypothetical protein